MNRATDATAPVCPVRWSAAAGGLLGLSLVLAGCGTSAQPSPAGSGSNTYLEGVLATPSATKADPLAADQRFIASLLQNQYQVVQEADHVLSRPDMDGEVRDMAQQHKDVANQRIGDLSSRLQAWGLEVPAAPEPLVDDTKPSGRPTGDPSEIQASKGQQAAADIRAGLLTASDQSALVTADDDAAGRIYLLQVHRLLQGGVSLAGTESDEGTDEETKKIASDLIDADRPRMQRILEKLGENGVVAAVPSPTAPNSGYQGPISLPSQAGGDGANVDYTPSALYEMWSTLPPPATSSSADGSSTGPSPSAQPTPTPADTASPRPTPGASAQPGAASSTASTTGAASTRNG